MLTSGKSVYISKNESSALQVCTLHEKFTDYENNSLYLGADMTAEVEQVFNP